MLISIAESSYAVSTVLNKTINQVSATDSFLEGSGVPAVFSKDLISTLRDGYGYGSYDFSADTDGHQTTLDNYGLITQCKGYEARFTGSRRNENLILLSSENLTREAGGASGWYASDGASALTIVDETTIRTGGGGTLDVLLNKNNAIDGTTRQYSGFMDAIIPNGLTVSLAIQGNGSGTGQYGKVPIIGDGTLHRYVTNLADNIVGGENWTGGVRLRLEIAGVDNDAQYDIRILRSKFEDVTGKPNSNVSDYVSVGVGTEPQEMLKSNLDGLVAGADYNLLLDSGVSYADDTNRFIFDGNGEFLAVIESASLFPIYEKDYTYYAEMDIDNFVHFDSGACDLFFSGYAFPSPTGNGTISVSGRSTTAIGNFFAHQSELGTGWAIFDITGLRAYKIDHGTNVDGVKCFPTENWNTHNETAHTIIDRSDYAPQLRQRVVRNILPSINPAEWDSNAVGIIADYGFPDPEGGNTAYRITTLGGATGDVRQTITPTIPAEFRNNMWFRMDESVGPGKIIGETVGFYTGKDAAEKLVLSNAYLQTEWIHIATDVGINIGGALTYFGTSLICLHPVIYYLWHPQAENVTDNANQNPSEYVSVGVATSIFNVNPDYLNDFYSSTWTFDSTSINAPNTAINVYFFPRESQNDTACYCPFLYEFSVSGMSGANINVGWLSGSVIATITTDGDYSINLGVSDSPFLLALPTFTPSGGLLTCKITNIKLYRIGHGYFGINENPSVLAFMDGYKGFNTENGNTVASNEVIAGTGIKIIPTDGLMIEPERENLTIYSTPDASNWTQTRSSIDNSYPLGSIDLVEIVEDATAAATHETLPDDNISYESGITYTESIIAKQGVGDRDIALRTSSSIYGEISGVAIDFTDGSFVAYGTPDAYGVENIGNNTYILWVTDTATATDTDRSVINLSSDGDAKTIIYDGDGTSSVYVGAMQCEAGDFNSSIIPTTGTALTRAGDDDEYTKDNISQYEGSAYLEFTPLYSGALGNLNDIFADTDGADELIAILGGTIRIRAGVTPVDSLVAPVKGQAHKVAVAWSTRTGELAISVDGNTTQTADRSFTGLSGSLDYVLNGYGQTRNVKTYDEVLSATKLQELTS